jgi:phosphoribosylformimino-5-aminoimidazole carboxamide ribotide isomerase
VIVLPAIDLMRGHVVRLRQGRKEDVTVYSDDPAAFARRWVEEGAEWLHIVDLDGAFTGEPANLAHVLAIVNAAGVPCELGGGMRTVESVQAALDAGVTRVVLGSRACDSMEFVREMATRFGSERIAVGIDAKDGKVAVKGWTETSGWDALTLAQAASVAGAGVIIYTDIATDGMLQGPNLAAMREMVAAVDVPVIASGGVSTADDITALGAIEGLYGVIVGKALYDGMVDLRSVLGTR